MERYITLHVTVNVTNFISLPRKIVKQHHGRVASVMAALPCLLLPMPTMPTTDGHLESRKLLELLTGLSALR